MKFGTGVARSSLLSKSLLQCDVLCFIGNKSYSTTASPKVPIVDLSGLSFPLQTSSPEVKKVAKDLHDAFSTYGFIYLKGHGISPKTQSDLVSNSRQLFDLPLETKMALHLKEGGLPWRGYMPLGGEQTHGRPDRKEGFYLGPDHPDDHPKVKSNTPTHGKNRLPDAAIPTLRPALNNYIDEVTNAGLNLMQVVSVSLGLDPHYINQHITMQEPIILFRLWNYPAQPNAQIVQKAENIGIDDHTDYGLVTLLKQEAPGLQFKTPKHGWIDVPPVENTLICNVGDLLDRITDGRYKSRPHRVLLNEVDDIKKARLSFPCFFDPHWDAPVRALPVNLPPPVDDGENKELRWEKTAYKTLTGNYWQYLAKKLNKVFPQLAGFEFEGARASSTRFHIKIDG